MNLSTSLLIASSGLSAVQHELGVASQNVANASTPGYVLEVAHVASRDSDGQGSGVVVQLTSRAVNETLQNALYTQNAVVSGLNVTANALSAVSSVQGSAAADAGSSGTLSDNLGNLQNDFAALESDPSSAPQQQTIIQDASTLASSIQALSSTYQAQRQDAQGSILSELASINSSLDTIGSLSQTIMQAKVGGMDTADLENQRSAAMSTLSSLVNLSFTETSSGDMLVTTQNGLLLPTNASSGPLSTDDATVDATVAYPGTVPGIMMNGQDVTGSLTGGSLGANITLRDSTLPTMQGELDSFASTLATRFSAQGLTLFTDASGNSPGADPSQAPPAGQLGFASTIQVNPTVSADPSLVRDGTQAIQDPTAGATIAAGAVLTGASAFTPNPTNGPAGFTTLIARVLNNTFGTEITTGTAQPAAAVSGLGVNGMLSAPFSGSGSLATLASTLTASQAQTISTATTTQTSQTDIQTTLAASLTATSGVSVDDQMASVVALQNAYEANAKIVSAVETMFNSLISALS